jgi:hypothetical protein
VSDGAAAQVAAVEQVGRLILDRVAIPKDRFEIAAQLEVLGFRDGDARDRFGCLDLFETADRIFAMFQNGRLPFVVRDDPPPSRFAPVLHFFRRYLDGLMFSMPMVLQGFTMLLWGYGLWGATELDVRTGSAIALAFIASYIATGGFSWAIVSRGLFYLYQKEGGLARWSALRMWSLSARLVIALVIPVLILNFVYGLLPANMALTAAAYYVALVLLWLNWSLTYLTGRTHWLLAVLLFSIGVVVVAARSFGWPVIAANLAGLVIADVLTFLVAFLGLNKLAKQSIGTPAVNPPRLTVLIYTSAPMFVYGVLYSSFLFTDRILAWTSSRGREDFPPYPFWLNARYELGMDLALIVVVVLAGVVEYSAHRFTSRLIPDEKRVKSEASGPFLSQFRSFYNRHSIFLWLSAVGAVFAASLVTTALREIADVRLLESLNSLTAVRVFWVAAISYAIFMYALRNTLILLSLSRTDLAVRALRLSLLFNIVVGFIASRAFHYSGAVFGLLAGCIVLAIVSDRHLRAVLRDLDYYYYAAY